MALNMQAPQTTRESDLGSLKEYSRLKIELASILRSTRQLAHSRNDAAQENECQKLMARLAEDRFNLAVVGQFNRGKTSLMNALLGSDRLPTGVLPLTSVVTSVCYGDREQALIQFRGSYLRQTIDLEDLPLFITEKGNPGNIKQVALAEVNLTANLLRLGFFFTDTPGVGSLITANTATTREFLPEVDAAIFVTSFESPLTEGELDFFEEVRSQVRTVFVVVNKADLVLPDQRAEILEFVRGKIGEKVGDEDLPIFAVSAREALDGKLTTGDIPGSSGLLSLEETLVRFLRTQKARALLTHVTDRIQALLKAQRAGLEVAERATADPHQAALTESQLRARADQLRGEQDNLLAPLSAQLGSELVGRFDHDLAAWREEVLTELVAQVQSFLKSADWLSLLAGAPELTATFSAECQQRAQKWFGDQGEAFKRTISAAAADCVSSLDRSAQAAFQADGSSWLSLAESSIRLESTSDILDLIPLAFPQPPPFHWPFKPRWWIYALPLRSARDRVLRECSESLDECLSDYLQEIRASLRLIANEWVNALRAKLAESLNAAVARTASILHAKPEPAERAAIDKLLGQLQKLQDSCAALHDPTDLDRDPTSDFESPNDRTHGALKSDTLGRCKICARIENELFQFFSKRQYDLSTKEIERLDHAAHGGFCALHTWQYESIASPQGICTAYPPIMLSLSQRLHSLAQGASPANAVDVEHLLSDTQTCEACRLIGDVKLQTAKDIVASLSGNVGESAKNLPALCLPHLSSVLLANPDAQLARLLVLEQARVMETIAEDMQGYALKHDAVRRYLATEGEWQAHRRGLSRLVGSRGLSKP